MINRDLSPEADLEPERYELYAQPAYRFQLARRQFFRALGGGIVVLFALEETPAAAAAQESGSGGRRGGGVGRRRTPGEIGAWLHVGENGAVTVFTGKVEVGQDIRTSLTQVVAEELRAPLPSIRLIMGDTDLCPFDMGTFGSRTTPIMAAQLRKVSAAARELLLDLAAEQGKTDRAGLVAQNGRITHPPTGESWAYGQLTKGQKLLKGVGEDAATTPVEAWHIGGTSVPRVNGRDVVTGRHRYTSDLRRPDMLHGKVLRPAALHAQLVSLEIGPAEKLPGVTVVRDGDFVGVTAPDTHVARQAIAALRAQWKADPQPSRRDLPELFKKNPAEPTPGPPAHATGSMEEGRRNAATTIERSYSVAYIAHAPLEPRAALAEWENDRLTVWTGTQRPFGVRTELAQAFRIPEARVRVIVPDTGSGYGGKHTGEAAIEAARLARATGKPVKLVWTREEEFTWAYFRPAGLIEVKSGATADGALTAWEYHNYNAGTAGIRTPYAIPHQHIAFHAAQQSPLRQGSYRALASTANHFARETHMDEMAHALKIDPLVLRRKNLKDERLLAVLEAAAERFGWGRMPSEPGRGVGIACGFEKGGYVATCAEVAVDGANGGVRIVRIVTAFECGAVVNPQNLTNQIEGAMVQGLGGALFEGIDFDNGRILTNRFSRYRVPRFSDTPLLETVLVNRKDLPSVGAGEAPIVALAPAVGSALFTATGVRLRSLPLVPQATLAPQSV